MTKLNQLIAIEKGVTSRTLDTWKNAYHRLQKPALFTGITRNYRPKDEEGDTLPPESTKVQARVIDEVDAVKDSLVRLFDVIASKDKTNTVATADIVLDNGTIVARDVPVPFLLYLEKKLTDVMTFVKKLPTLDPSEEWEWDDNANAYRTPISQTTRTKKVPKAFVKAPATERHAAQVEVFNEDVIVGTWDTVKFSGALPVKTVTEMAERVEALQKAVKFAREAANATDVTDLQVGRDITSYIFG